MATSDDLAIITDVRDMSPAWLTAALAGVLDGGTVTAVDGIPVGTGQMGDSVRLALTHDGGPGAPSSIVAKLPAADPKSRTTAAGTRSYEIEVNFYRHVGPTLDVRTPRCYCALHDPVTHDFVLLLEDLAPAQQGDQLTGCSVAHAEIAVDELPGLHAPRWGDPALAEFDWLNRYTPEGVFFTAQFVASLHPGFRERYDGRVSPDIMVLSDELMATLPTYMASRSEPSTVVHGDYRLDNLLFGTPEGGYPVAVVDWQTVSLGPAASDLAYFIGAGLVTEDRREHERDLVDRYRAGMASRGVVFDPDDLWEQYRRATFSGLIMAIAASMLVEQTTRGDEMFITMAERHGRHAIDLEAMSLIT